MADRAVALSVGSLFPRMDTRLTVHSVFRTAVNLVGADPYPVAVLSPSAHRHPRCVVVAGLPPDLTTLGWRPHDVVLLNEGRLSGPGWGIDLRTATAFAEDLPRVSLNLEVVNAAALTLARLQDRAHLPLRIDGLRHPTTPLVTRVAAALNALDRWEPTGAEALLGLGPGLTPTGDDVLVGWLAAAATVGCRLPDWSGMLGRTNLISASFVDSALKGRFASSLVALAGALARGSDARAELEALALIGHSSGLDVATGFLVGVQRLTRAD